MVKFKDSPRSLPPNSSSNPGTNPGSNPGSNPGTIVRKQSSGRLIRHEVVSSCIAVIIECVKHQVFLTQSCDTQEGVKQSWLPFILTTDHDDKGWKERAVDLVKKTLALDSRMSTIGQPASDDYEADDYGADDYGADERGWSSRRKIWWSRN